MVATAGDADAGRLPSGSKTSTGIDGAKVKLTRTGESVRRLHSVANNGAGRSAAVSGTYKTTITKGGTGIMTVGYLVGCQIDITGLQGGISGTISTGPSLSGSLSIPLKPGEVKFVKSTGMTVKKGHATIVVDNFELAAQGCGGYASARSVAQVLSGKGLSTEDDKLTGDGGFLQTTLYGKPFSIG